MLHIPVVLKETLEYLDIQSGDTVLDATVGEGGHAVPIAGKILPEGKLIGIEQDREILRNLRFKIQDLGIKNISLINGNFRNLDELLKPLKIKKIDAALFDLGMNSSQLEKSGRGFTFQKNEPLAMSFKPEIDPGDLTAKEILNSWPEKEIYKTLKDYGEERYAGRIARGIVRAREAAPFEKTFDLVLAIRKSVPAFYCRQKVNCATKTFQALRIAVNDELRALEEGLEKSWNLLEKEGRLVVISFHSLEDRIVKNFLRNKKEKAEAEILTKKPIRPSEREVKENPRSRSAKLRAGKKIWAFL